MCDRVFDESDILITGLKPCEYVYKKMTCSQQNKDHGQLHRFGSSARKKKGQMIFNEEESVDVRREKFFARVRSSLSVNELILFCFLCVCVCVIYND